MKKVLIIVGAICAATAALAQQQTTLGTQGAQWMQQTATELSQHTGDNGKPMQIVATPEYFVVNGKALSYSDAANMTPDQVLAFGQQNL